MTVLHPKRFVGILRIISVATKKLIRVRKFFHLIVNAMLGFLFLFGVFSSDDASAQCDITTCAWFELKLDSGPDSTIVYNTDSYASTKIRYHYRTSPAGTPSTRVDFLVSERIDGGNWIDSDVASGTGAKRDYADVGINQAIRLQIPKSRLNRDPLGSWYATGPGTHSAENRYTFVPDVDAVKRIQKGHKFEVRIVAKLYFDGSIVREREFLIAYTNLDSSSLSWEANNNPTIISDGSSTYGDLDGLITNTPAGRVPLLFGGYEIKPNGERTSATVGSTREITSKYEGWEVPVGDNFKYGSWVISRHGDKFLFRPKSDAINKLWGNQVVVSVLEVTPRDGNGNPAADKATIRVLIGKAGINVSWGNELELDSEGNPIITIDHSSDYADLHPTLSVVKITGDYYHGGADDYLNGNSMKIVGSNGPASGDLDADNLPSGFVKADTRVYGRGWSNGNGKHRGGVWIFDGRKDLVAFRPIKERLDDLEPGEFVESYLNLILRRLSANHAIVATKTLKVTIKKAEPAKVSINDIELEEDLGAVSTEFRFKVSIDSEVAVGESFTVPVAFSHETTDRFDFLGDTDPTIPDVNFGPGDTEQIVSILVKRDSDKESDESFTLKLSEPTGDAKTSNLVTLDTELGASVGTGTILDDDRALLSIEDITLDEENGDGSTEFQFTVSLSPATALNQTFTVPVTFAHLSTNRHDFVSDPAQTNFDVNFGTTDTSQTIRIMVQQDGQGEEHERFTLTLSEPTGDAKDMNLVTLSSVPGATVGLGTINNDDSKLFTSTWLSEFEEPIVGDGAAEQYGYRVGYVTDGFVGTVGYSVTESENGTIINSASPTSNDRVYLDESKYPEFTGSNSSMFVMDRNFKYVLWYWRTQNNGCQLDWCAHVLFVPNARAINQLNPGDVVKSSFSISKWTGGFETSVLTVNITNDFNTNGIGFDVDSKSIEAGESESATLEVSLPEGISGPVTIPFSISDGTARYPVDFRTPPSSSLTIPTGETRGTISIPIVDDSSHEGEETFTVSLGDGADFAIEPALQTATVKILDNDPIGTTLPRGRECHEVTQPASVTTPNTRVYWETPAAKVYYAPHEKIDVRMGFKEMVRIEADFNYGAFFGDGNPENADLSKAAFVNLTGVDFQINRPGNHRGKFQYAILPSSETDNKWYHIDAPCVFHVWWTDGSRPGIALSIEQDSVLEGKPFRVKATATPAPDRDLLIPVFLSDESRIEDSQTYDILIEAGETSGFKDIHTRFMSGDQTADEVVATTEWRNTYWLDSSDAVKSDTVTIQDHDKKLVKFKSSNLSITVNETGNADLIVEYEGTPSQSVTVNYRIGGNNDTADTSDFMAVANGEITLLATSNEGTISIPIEQDTTHEETEFFTVTLIESNDALPSVRNSVATVTILSNDRPTETPPSSSCDAITQPVGVTTPNTEAYWAGIPEVYQEPNDGNITVRMGFRNPSNPTPAYFRIGIYNIDGTVENNNISLTSVANTDHLDFLLIPPTDNKRYKYYRILESSHSDNRWYRIGTPCDFQIWWVDEGMPGITLTIEEESVVEGESVTITATATPEPSRDILVPFSISDVSRIEDSQVYSIRIGAGQSSGQTELLTKSVTGDQSADELTVTAEWQSSYLLDKVAGSDVITIVEETGVSLISINDLTLGEDDVSGSTAFRFRVSLSPETALGQTFTVPIDFSHVSTDRFDFMNDEDPSNLAVHFGAGDTEQFITVFVNNDTDKESDETFTLTLLEPTGDAKNMNLVTLSSIQGATVGTGTITNDDSATVSIASVSMDEDTETEGNRFQFAVSLSPAVALGQTFNVPITFGQGTTDNDDFVTGQDLNSLSAVFGIADTERMVSIAVELDSHNEGDETFTLTLLEPTGDAKNMNLVTLSSVQGATVGTGTIINNDQATISIDNVSKAEGTGSEDTKFEFTVSLSPAEALSQDFSVPLTFKHVSTDDADFVDGSLAALPASVNFATADAKTEDKIEITVKSDSIGELDETFTLTLSEPTGAAKDMNLVKLSTTENIGTGTITTDDGTVVTIESLSIEENSGDQNFSVPVAFQHGTTNDDDFARNSLDSIPSSVEIDAGETSAVIDIMVGWDDDNEGDESFTLTISEPTGPAKDMNLVTLSTTPGGNVGTGRIVNDDQAILSIDSVSLAENSGTGGNTLFQFTVGLTPAEALNQQFSVPLTFQHGSTDQYDFVDDIPPPIPAVLDFAAEATSMNIEVRVKWDEDTEPDETFTLTISEPTGNARDLNLVKLSAANGANVGTGTIRDDDDQISVDIQDLTIDIPSIAYAYESSDTVTIALTLNGVPQTFATVTASTISSTGSATTASQYASAGEDYMEYADREFDLKTNNSMPTVTVDLIDDSIPEENESFQVSIFTSSSATITGADGSGTKLVEVVIIDDDQYPTVEVSAVNDAVTEGEDVEFAIEANFHGKPSEDIVVHYQVTQSGDYLFVPVSRKLVVNNETSIMRLPTFDDNADGSGGTVTLTLLDGNEYTYRTHPGRNSDTVAISDNDSGSVKSPEKLYSVASSVIASILRTSGTNESADSTRESSRVSVSIFAVEKTVKEGDSIRIAISVAGDNRTGIDVNIGLTETVDFVDEGEPVNVSIPVGSNTADHEIPTVDDDLSENDGIVTVFIRESEEYSVGDPSTVEIRVTDEEDRSARRSQVSEAQLTVLPEIAGSIGARSLGAMSHRMSQAFSDTTGPELEFNGGSTLKEMLTSGVRSFDKGGVSWEEMLGDSSFKLDLLPETSGASTATIWGLGDFRNLTVGSSSFRNAHGGSVFTGHIGIDTRIGQNIVSGFTTSNASAETIFGQGNSQVRLQSRTTGVHPYVGLRSADGDNRLDVIAGYGLGEVVLDQVRYASETLRSSTYNVGLSGRSELYTDEGFLGGTGRISATGDSWLARLFLKNEDGFVEGSRTKVGYARMAIEGTQEYELTSSDKFRTESSLGVAADEKGDLSFVGLQLETGLSYENPFGLTLEGDSVMVATNGGQVREIGLTGNMNFDRGRDGRGLMLNVFRVWGKEFSETEKSLWGANQLNNTITGTNERDSRIEIGYGFDVLDESAVLTPYSAFHQANSHGTEFRVGSRIATGKGHNFELEIGRDIPATGTRGHEVSLTGSIRW